jgi:hypothetical protein
MFDQFEELRGCAGVGLETTWDRHTDIWLMATVKSDFDLSFGQAIWVSPPLYSKHQRLCAIEHQPRQEGPQRAEENYRLSTQSFRKDGLVRQLVTKMYNLGHRHL